VKRVAKKRVAKKRAAQGDWQNPRPSFVKLHIRKMKAPDETPEPLHFPTVLSLTAF